MRATISEIGNAIRQAAIYPPIRNLAAKWAARAAPKDFEGQLNEIYQAFIKRCRYVMDPARRELLTASPEALYKLVLAGDGVGLGEGRGAGDCDCMAAALGALCESVGFPVVITTTADRGAPPGSLYGHVFIHARTPYGKWVTMDPVLYSWAHDYGRKRFGDITKWSRIAHWDQNGRLLSQRGNYKNLGVTEGSFMYGIPSVDRWQDQGLMGLAGSPEETPVDWDNVVMGFGDASPDWGMIDGTALAGIGVETGEEEDWGGVMGVRTPMLEVSPEDYTYISFCGVPYTGMFALGDDGEMYTYDGTLGRGFFRRLFRKIRRGVKKVAKKIRKGIRAVIKRLPFGKFLLKIAGKIRKIAMKIVRPLVKFVGKWASKLAPIAAIIPGYGTAIAAGLAAALRFISAASAFS
jgi:hypothetical protein